MVIYILQYDARYTQRQIKKETIEKYIWNIGVYGTKIWTLRNVDHKYLEKFRNAMPEKDGKHQLAG